MEGSVYKYATSITHVITYRNLSSEMSTHLRSMHPAVPKISASL